MRREQHLASMISLEQEKNAPNWEKANKIRLSLY